MHKLKKVMIMNRPRSGIIPIASAEKILKQAGAHRVADAAAERLRDILEEKGKDIAQKAIQMSIHAGRRTVKSGDIVLASK